MCLVVRYNGRFQATEDIPCYKVLICTTNRKGEKEWSTPYKQTPITEAQLCGLTPFYSDDIFDSHIFISKDREVNGGAIHTFRNERDALREAKGGWLTQDGKETHVFRCIIPKGVIYVKGWYDNDEAFASKQIIFKEEIKQDNVFIH